MTNLFTFRILDFALKTRVASGFLLDIPGSERAHNCHKMVSSGELFVVAEILT